MAGSAPLLVLLMICSQTRMQNGLNAEFDENAFKRAVVQAYNASKSFSQNFYELLGLICPESTYCQTNGTFDKEGADFWSHATDNVSGSEGFLQNYDDTAISEAQDFLQRNVHHLRGCCVHCSCNSDCKERQNCCPSILGQTAYQGSLEATDLITQECVYANFNYYLYNDNAQTNSFAETLGNSYFMVNDCNSTNVDKDAATRCTHPDLERPNETIPVYSTDAKSVYKNMFCARCNDAGPVTAMTPLITISNLLSLTEKGRVLPGSPFQLYNMAMSRRRFYDIKYIFPTKKLDVRNFGCVNVPSSRVYNSARCDTNPELDESQLYLFKRACGMEQHLYHTQMTPFRNVFCFLCYPDIWARKSECGLVDQSVKFTEDSFSVLLVARQLEELEHPDVASQAEEPCSCAEVFDSSKNVCRQILCPPGEIRIACDCVPFITNLTGLNIRLHLEIRPLLPDIDSMKQFGDKLLQSDNWVTITTTVKRLVATRFGPLKSVKQYLFRERASAEKRTWTFHYCEVLRLRDAADDREELDTMFTTLHAGLTKKIVGVPMLISLGQLFDIGSIYNMTVTDPIDGTSVLLERLYPGLDDFKRNWGNGMLTSQPLKKLVYCKRVKLDDNEKELLHNGTVTLGGSRSYLRYVYWEEDGGMCLEDFKAAFMPGAACRTSPKTGRELLLLISAWMIYNTEIY